MCASKEGEVGGDSLSSEAKKWCNCVDENDTRAPTTHTQTMDPPIVVGGNEKRRHVLSAAHPLHVGAANLYEKLP